MKVDNSINSQNFKQITISRQEARQVNKLFREYRNNKSQDVVKQMFDIYASKVERECRINCKSKKDLSDYIHDIYLYMIENFISKQEEHDPAHTFTVNINSKIEKLKKNIISQKFQSLNQLSKENIEKYSYEEEINKPEPAKELIEKLVRTTDNLNEQEKNFIKQYLLNYSLAEAGNKCGLTREEVNRIFLKTIHKIKFQHNSRYRKICSMEVKDSFPEMDIQAKQKELVKDLINAELANLGYKNRL